MISRRIFSQQAALFVLGCALQVCGAVTAIKRKVERLDQFDIGMVFQNPKNPTEIWQIVGEGKKCHPHPQWLCQKQGVRHVPEMFCFASSCNPPGVIKEWNCHFPGI